MVMISKVVDEFNEIINYKFIKKFKCKLEKKYVAFYSWRLIARSYSQTLKSNFSKIMVQKIII